MAKTAFLFPGQGGQFVGQGQKFLDRGPYLSALLNLAEEISGLRLKKISLEGPLEELNQTVNLQPAILTLSLALAKILIDEGAEPLAAAGHSLGEYGALTLAGVFDEEKALCLVATRAKLCQRAAEERPGAMAAILNLPGEEVAKLCELATAVGQVAPANFNAPTQTVVSGEVKAVSAVVRYAELKKGKAIILPVSGAFHSPLMVPAAAEMKAILLETEFRKPRFPVLPNALGEPVDDPDRLKELLIEQMTSPVLWVKTAESLVALGPDEFVECWPKLYVGSLVKKCLPKDLKINVRVPA
ncbi:MAG: ACP S-malonyltransferase [Deltaproteobacteria bacterium]|jgi:[acyl-carrier-protein] S-malonyltransferase|nr:ACP S-malonyltransferase [Deltaproteobacteria bacterium]